MVKFISMTDNIVTSDQVAVKKPSKKKVPRVQVVAEESTPQEQKGLPQREFSVSSLDKKFVYFSSGSAYVTKSGFRFTRDKRIYELDVEEADALLKLDNFRLPDQLELEEYYKENN